MTTLTKTSIISGAILAVVVGLLATSVRAVSFDIRDYFPDGTLFELADITLELNWDTSTQTLEVISDQLVLETESWLDRLGRLVFTASPPTAASSGISSVDGIIDLRPNGDFYLEVDQYRDDGTVGAMQAWSDGVSTTATGTCDCTDNIQLTCYTNLCNKGSDCPDAEDYTCEWEAVVVH